MNPKLLTPKRDHITFPKAILSSEVSFSLPIDHLVLHGVGSSEI